MAEPIETPEELAWKLYNAIGLVDMWSNEEASRDLAAIERIITADRAAIRAQALADAKQAVAEVVTNYADAHSAGGGKAALDMQCGALSCEEAIDALRAQEVG